MTTRPALPKTFAECPRWMRRGVIAHLRDVAKEAKWHGSRDVARGYRLAARALRELGKKGK